MSEISQNSKYCCICLTIKDDVKKHCTSGIICSDCIEKYNKDECPICREYTDLFTKEIINELDRKEHNWICSYYRFNAVKILIIQIFVSILTFYVTSVFGFIIIRLFNLNEDNFGTFGICGLGLMTYFIIKSIFDYIFSPRPPALELIARNRRRQFNVRNYIGGYYHPNALNIHPIADHIISRRRLRQRRRFINI